MAGAVEMSLTMPAELGARVVAGAAVQQLLAATPDARIQPVADPGQVSGGFHDVNATALMILGTPAVVAGVKGMFDLIRTAVAEAHRTRRAQQAQRHELRKLLLVVGTNRVELDLDEEIQQVEQRIAELEAATTALP